MWILELFLSIVLAVVFVGLLVFILKPSQEENRGLTALLFLFLAFFLPIRAGGIWLGPMGPAIFGLYVFSFPSHRFVRCLAVGRRVPSPEGSNFKPRIV